MDEMRGLEPGDSDIRNLRQLMPQPGPQTLRFDRDARQLADFVTYLRLISKIRDENDLTRRNEQKTARAGKAGEVAEVREARDEEAVDVGRGQTVGERGEAFGARIRHVPPANARDRATPARIRTRRVRKRRQSRPGRASNDAALAPEHRC